MEDLTVAAVNFHSDFGEIDSNLGRIRSWAAQMAKEGVDILAFPEMSVCGYENSWLISPFMDQIPGSITTQLQKIAEDYQITLIAGLAEQVRGTVRYISQVFVSPHGQLGVYRKTHLSPQEANYFLPGDQCPVFDHPKARVGILVCHDLRFPEACTLLALQGVEVVFVCMAASPHPKYSIANKLHRLLPARALDNTIFMITCNQVGIGHKGRVFGGAAMVAKPDGEIVREVASKGESVLKYRLRAKALQKIRQSPYLHCMQDRRPELYDKLSQPRAG